MLSGLKELSLEPRIEIIVDLIQLQNWSTQGDLSKYNV